MAFRVKNLRGTSGCTHYRGLGASANSTTSCAVNGCSDVANRACHVIYANQNADTGNRLIVYLCASHNAIYDQVLSIGENRIAYILDDCDCGWWP
jgi:hypothetical protein